MDKADHSGVRDCAPLKASPKANDIDLTRQVMLSRKHKLCELHNRRVMRERLGVK